jgi:2,3-bisphosphoglycerate-dependent phosphoglycerate mutase
MIVPHRNGSLRFVRHGATGPNLAGVRCGGDLDVPLADEGRAQAADIAAHVAALDPPVGLIVTSALRRTRETAAIIAEALPGVPTLVEADFAERSLGAWNLRPLAETQPWFDARMTPPGGESDDEFVVRVSHALRRLKPRLCSANWSACRAGCSSATRR